MLGEKVHLGSLKTLEEAASAWDAATIKINGPNATTNNSLGFISAKVAKTKVCRNAAKQARNRVKEHQLKVMMQKLKAMEAASTPEKRRAIFVSLVAAPRVRVTTYVPTS